MSQINDKLLILYNIINEYTNLQSDISIDDVRNKETNIIKLFIEIISSSNFKTILNDINLKNNETVLTQSGGNILTIQTFIFMLITIIMICNAMTPGLKPTFFQGVRNTKKLYNALRDGDESLKIINREKEFNLQNSLPLIIGPSSQELYKNLENKGILNKIRISALTNIINNTNNLIRQFKNDNKLNIQHVIIVSKIAFGVLRLVDKRYMIPEYLNNSIQMYDTMKIVMPLIKNEMENLTEEEKKYFLLEANLIGGKKRKLTLRKKVKIRSSKKKYLRKKKTRKNNNLCI